MTINKFWWNGLDRGLGIVALAMIVVLTSIVLPGAALGLTLPGLTGASDQPPEQPAPTPAPPPTERASPRATMHTFLTAMAARDWERATATLHLPRDEYPADVLEMRGR